MTYIEFFDRIASENVSACLTYAPERVIYIGDNKKLMERHIRYYSRVFEGRGQKIEFRYRTVSKSNLDNAVEVLQELVDRYDDCVFDITGGEEILTLALGIVFERNPDRNIQIHRFNLRSNTIADCDKNGVTIYREPPTLSAEENVRIYGGDIVYGGISEDKTYRWDLTEEFVRDVELIWSVCRANTKRWNAQIGTLEAVERAGATSGDGLTTTADLPAVRAALYPYSCKISRSIITKLLEYGLLTQFEYGETITVSYKDEQVKKCLTKAGQALEMKIFVAAKRLTDDGVPVYDDAVNGAVIDWDGELHEEETEAVYDTENEIDVLLMHGVVPVFVSCKNGMVTADELYKLDVVAGRFGGKYAKRVLVATSRSVSGEAGRYFRQRARDMNIRLIENVQALNDEELAGKLKTLWCN